MAISSAPVGAMNILKESPCVCNLTLGEAQLLAGRLEDAHAVAKGALSLARAHQERGNEAYILHLLGEIAMRRDPPDVALAAAYYQQALVGLQSRYAGGSQRKSSRIAALFLVW